MEMSNVKTVRVPRTTGQPWSRTAANLVFVVWAYKDGGAMGFDEWDLVTVCATEDLARFEAKKFIDAREDRRWWPTIEEKTLVRRSTSASTCTRSRSHCREQLIADMDSCRCHSRRPRR